MHHWNGSAALPGFAAFTLATALGAAPLAAQTPDTTVADTAGAAVAQAPAERTTIGGYGEVHYTNARGAGTPGTINLRRFVLFVGHSFSERLAFRSEVEIEDAKIEGGEPGGEVALEQAYIDYRFSPAFTLRTGLLLAPVGIVNEVHEPPTFNGVERPDFDHDVIPTTWRELGIGAAGSFGQSGLGYRLYLLNGLKGSGLSADEGIRGGRQEGHEAGFQNPSLTGRLEYGRPGLKLGASFWYGGTAEQNPAIGTGTFDAPIFLAAADARYDVGAFQFRGVFANIQIPDADRLNAAYGGAVAKRITGGYAEGAVNLLAVLVPAATQQLNAFVRHERYDTQADVPAGVTDDPANARRLTTFGLTYKPLWNVAFKGDYQLRRNAAGTGEGEVFRLGAGYQF
ncbi:MAG TPA: hypothetical protein VFS40_07580 [Gemmatimonadales bacterium]|nr:hypothetical protein [Gemmatimonadales bacterium]